MSRQLPEPRIGLDLTDPVPAPHPARVIHPLVRYLDVVVLALATAPALVLGAPVFGYLLAGGGWILQRVLGEADRRWIRRFPEPRKQLGVSLFEAFGRIWLLAGVIIVAGLVGGRRDGETAALVIFGAYTVGFAVRVLSGPPRRTVAP